MTPSPLPPLVPFFFFTASPSDTSQAALLESTLRASRETWEDAEIQKQLDEVRRREERRREGGERRCRAGLKDSSEMIVAARIHAEQI